MPLTIENARALASLVGTPYAQMNCWEFVRTGFGCNDVELPGGYHATIAAGIFARVSEPAPWDVIAIELPRDRADVALPKFANHCGIYLGDEEFIHSVDPAGVCVSRIDRAPWATRIVGFMRLFSTP